MANKNLIPLMILLWLNSTFAACSSGQEVNKSPQIIQNEMIDTSNDRTVIWEEFHPGHSKSDFFIIRLYSNGDYERFSNVVLKVGTDLSPIYEKVDYEWRKEYTISEEGVKSVLHLLSTKIDLFPPIVEITESTEREKSIIRAYVNSEEYIIELPNEKYDPLRYKFVQEVNELILQNIN